MKVYILKKDWRNATAGTKFFLQDGMYFYKTQTEMEFFASPEEVENDPENFKLFDDGKSEMGSAASK